MTLPLPGERRKLTSIGRNPRVFIAVCTRTGEHRGHPCVYWTNAAGTQVTTTPTRRRISGIGGPMFGRYSLSRWLASPRA